MRNAVPHTIDGTRNADINICFNQNLPLILDQRKLKYSQNVKKDFQRFEKMFYYVKKQLRGILNCKKYNKQVSSYKIRK